MKKVLLLVSHCELPQDNVTFSQRGYTQIYVYTYVDGQKKTKKTRD